MLNPEGLLASVPGPAPQFELLPIPGEGSGVVPLLPRGEEGIEWKVSIDRESKD